MNTKFLDEMDNTDYALQLAKGGWHVFPCLPQDEGVRTVKSPLILKADGGNGHHDATTDPDKVYSWWERYPNALVGISCEKSGLLVVDPDRHEGEPDGVAAFSEMIEDIGGGSIICGPSQTTPNNGQHFIFKAPKIPADFNIPGKLAPGIDIKYNGYICTGRLSDGRRYEWLPGHSFDLPLTYPPAWVCKMIVQHYEASMKSKEPVKRTAPNGGPLPPGADYAIKTDWGDILPKGWRRSGRVGDVEYWTRPGKRAGVSATVNFSGKENLYIFSTNASPFEPQKSYSKFAAYALLKHGGDFSAAARALASAGYGKQTSSTGSTK